MEESLNANLGDESHEPFKLTTLFDKYTQEKVGGFHPQLDTNPHAIIETLLQELHSNAQQGFKELFTLLSTQPFQNTCHQCSYALGLLLKLQGFNAVFLLDSYQVEPPEKTKYSITKKEPEKKFASQGLQYNPHCLLGVVINDVEYLISPKHFIVAHDLLHSTLEPESHLFKSPVYLRRIITDQLREKNQGWDPVAFPLWLKLDTEQKYYKVFSRTQLIID